MSATIILPSDPLATAIIREIQSRIPILEDPLGSNRSPEIDALCRKWGIPLGSYWCAVLAADVWSVAGAEVPPTNGDSHPARCESWRRWALATGRFSATPGLGYAVLYGEGGKEPAEHMGVAIASIHPLMYDFEGNTADAASRQFTRNGELATLKMVDVNRVVGYVSPRPLP